jgi:hypothetical protein
VGAWWPAMARRRRHPAFAQRSTQSDVGPRRTGIRP